MSHNDKFYLKNAAYLRMAKDQSFHRRKSDMHYFHLKMSYLVLYFDRA